MSSRRLLAAVPVAAIACVLACDVVLGINGYDKCDACGGDAGDAGPADVVVDVVDDTFQLPDGVSEGSSWATFPMPNTPYEVDAGASDASLASFDGSGPYYDNVTHLFWAATVGSAQSIEEATTYCASLPQGSWRVPTRIELATLLDSTQAGAPYVTPTLAGLVGTSNTVLWSSSYVRPIGQPLQYWVASTLTGDMVRSNPVPGGVLCVH